MSAVAGKRLADRKMWKMWKMVWGIVATMKEIEKTVIEKKVSKEWEKETKWTAAKAWATCRVIATSRSFDCTFVARV